MIVACQLLVTVSTMLALSHYVPYRYRSTAELNTAETDNYILNLFGSSSISRMPMTGILTSVIVNASNCVTF
jgi:hypothetical protein